MRKKIFAANWKMHKSPKEAKEFFKLFLAKLKPTSSEIVFFVPALVGAMVAELIKNSFVKWGLQNCYFEPQGPFTGENSALVAKDMGASYILVGHSERRHLFSETNEFIAKKIHFVQKLGLTPVLCVGENLTEREKNLNEKIILEQLKHGLSLAHLNQPLVIAYEPVWAIGTGKVATPEQAEEAHQILRQALGQQGSNISILYGGSVKPENASDLLQKENIDGFLVGGASLEPESFLKILGQV